MSDGEIKNEGWKEKGWEERQKDKERGKKKELKGRKKYVCVEKIILLDGNCYYHNKYVLSRLVL